MSNYDMIINLKDERMPCSRLDAIELMIFYKDKFSCNTVVYKMNGDIEFEFRYSQSRNVFLRGTITPVNPIKIQ